MVLHNYLYLLLSVSALMLVGCDTSTPAHETGNFNGNVDGTITGSVEGSAIQRDVDGVLLTITASATDTPCSVELSVSSVRPPDTLFTQLGGVYAVTQTPTSTENRRLVTANVEVEATEVSANCDGSFRGESGEVRVEQATPNRLDGTISLRAISADTAAEPADTLTVNGEFSAARRDVEG